MEGMCHRVMTLESLSTGEFRRVRKRARGVGRRLVGLECYYDYKHTMSFIEVRSMEA
jgi:hypothetical protein